MKKRFNIASIAHKRLWSLLEFVGNKETDIDGYLLKKIHAPKLDPIKKKKLSYPESLFPMQNAPLEWWYFTGHLRGKREEKYGFEFCIFKLHPEIIRLGFLPLYLLKKAPFLISHIAITDKSKNIFTTKQDSGLVHNNKINYDRLELGINRSFLKLDKDFKIKNELMDLKLKPVKKWIKHFDEGFQLTHKHPETRSYYTSFTRLNVNGKIKINNKSQNVSGEAWFDHQKCNMIKKSTLIGWDWFSLMFNDGTELMFYEVKDKKGFDHARLGGTYIDKDSKKVDIKPKEISIKVLDHWRSSKTGIVYPSEWNIQIKKLNLNLGVVPYVKNQEIDSLFNTGTTYWEGAAKVTGIKKNKKVEGEGYVELVGYDHRLVQKILRETVVE